MATAFAMIGIQILFSAALWGLGMLLKKPKNVVEGEIKDRETQISSYGIPKPILYGQCKVALELVWAIPQLLPYYVEQPVGSGKGGGGGSDTVTHTYYVAAYAGILGIAPDPDVFGEMQLIKLWADDKLSLNYAADNDGVTEGPWWFYHGKFYPGTDDQPLDPMLQYNLGATGTPAYRGRPLISIWGHNVTYYGNRIPTIRALVAPGMASPAGIYPVIGYDTDYPLEYGWADDPIGDVLEAGLVLTQDEQFIIAMISWWPDENPPNAATTLRRISTLTRQVVAEKTYYDTDIMDLLGDEIGEWEGCTPFYYFQAFDVDERGYVYGPLCEGYGPIAKVDMDTLTIQDFGPFKPESLTHQTERVLVSKNPSYPYLWGWFTSVLGGDAWIDLIHRDNLNNPIGGSDCGGYSMGDYSFMICHPFSVASEYGASADPLACALDNRDASLYVLWETGNQYNEEYPETQWWLGHYYTDGTGEELIEITEALLGIDPDGDLWFDTLTFDENTNQLILQYADNLVFMDATTGAITGTIGSFLESVGNWAIAYWQRGVVGQYFYITDLWDYTIYKVDVVNHTYQAIYDLSPYLDTPEDPDAWLTPPGGVYCSYRNSVFLHLRIDDIHMQEVMFGRITVGTVDLADIVYDLCKRAGMEDGNINAESLRGTEVKGYVVSGGQTAREAIEALMEAFIFDAVDEDGVLKFIKRGNLSIATIPESDIAIFLHGSNETPEPLEIEIPEETNLPRKTEVSYPDINFKHETNEQSYERFLTASKVIKTINTPILMDKDQAKQLAHISMKYDWNAKACTLVLGPKWCRLSPTDVVTVTRQEGTYRIMLMEVQKEGLLYKWKGIIEDFTLAGEEAWSGSSGGAVGGGIDYTSDETGIPPPDVEEEVFYPGPSRFQLIDVPPLVDDNNTPGIYIASGGITSDFTGATVYVSKDLGESWTLMGEAPRRAITGVVTSQALSNFDSNGMDYGSQFTVTWDLDTDALASRTNLEFVGGTGHYLLVGNEIIVARDVTTNPDGSQTFTGPFIRGAKGTEYARNGHTVSERVVALTQTTVFFVNLNTSYLNASYQYAGVAIGDVWDNRVQKNFTTELRTVKPWAGVQAEGARDGSNNLTITWVRRDRLGHLNPFWAGTEVPMSETSEAYEVDILDGETVVRTITGLSGESANYTAAEQTSDGLTPGNPVDCIIYQISGTIGRGWPLEATV